MVRQTFEGTWEEIVQHASELAGQRVRVTVLDKADRTPGALPPGTSLADLMKDYIGSVSSPEPHDDARRAEEIWGEYVVEKHRKNGERQALMLCDTGPLVALVDTSDADHGACTAVIPSLKTALLTTWPCLTEAMYLLGRRHGYWRQRDLWHLTQIGALEIHQPTLPQLPRMRNLMAQYQSVPMDLADASLVAAAEALNLTQIFTLDKDFLIYRLPDSRAFEIIP